MNNYIGIDADLYFQVLKRNQLLSELNQSCLQQCFSGTNHVKTVLLIRNIFMNVSGFERTRDFCSSDGAPSRSEAESQSGERGP